jgi:hypothetical protein
MKPDRCSCVPIRGRIQGSSTIFEQIQVVHDGQFSHNPPPFVVGGAFEVTVAGLVFMAIEEPV